MNIRIRRNRLWIIISVYITVFCMQGAYAQSNTAVPKKYRVQVLQEYPHDVTSYTQGLFFYKGVMYESTGQYGESHFIKVDYKSGKWLRKWKYLDKYFLEGSCAFADRFYILTWLEHTCFVYDAATFKRIGKPAYPTEGWGLTTDGRQLIMSDGSSWLSFMDPESFYATRRLQVTFGGKPLELLNELEYIEGKIWANVYLTDNIVIINPQNGVVEAVIDCTGLLPDNLKTPETDVLNGIAYDPDSRSIYITGKYWPRLYRISYK